MTPQEVLLKAADLVEAGWCRNTYHTLAPDGTDQYCVNGALMMAAGRCLPRELGEPTLEKPWDGDACWEASRILTETVGVANIVVWNDDQATSGEDVAAWMRKAAKA